MDKSLGLKDGDLAIILQYIAKFPAIHKAVVFGSRAKGNYKPGSDVDLAIWVDDNMSCLQLSADLNEVTLLPYKFDVISYAMIDNQDLKDHINRIGIAIY